MNERKVEICINASLTFYSLPSLTRMSLSFHARTAKSAFSFKWLEGHISINRQKDYKTSAKTVE